MKIYTLHSVANNGFSLSLEHFERFVRYLSKRYRFADPKLLGDTAEQGQVLLTFDDCYADNFTNALPILSRYNAKAIFFFTPAFLGRVRWGSLTKGNWADEKSSAYSIPFSFMGLSELEVLRSMGHEIGFHSRSHENLTECSDEALTDEIVHAKREWEDRIGGKFRYFAYPRGRYAERMFPLLQRAEYRFAMTTVHGEATEEVCRTRPYALPRFAVQRKGLFGWL